MSKIDQLRPLLGLLILSVILLPALPAQATYQLGDVVDDFTLNDLTGTPVSLSDYAGDIVVINFFATWCPGCNVEAAILENNIHLVYQEHDVTVIAIDMQEQVAIVQNWVDSQGVTYQILLTPDWDLFSLFPVAGGLPYNAIIGRDGVLRYAQILFNEEAIISTLNNLLGFDPVADEAQSFGQVKALYR